jgi:hypothetical protein
MKHRRILLALCFCSQTQADESIITPLFIQGNYIPMSGAMSALTNDAESIFFNPAGLGANHEITLNLLNAEFIASNDLINTYSSLSTLKSASSDPAVLNTLLGKDLYLRGSAGALVGVPRISFAVVTDVQLSAFLQSKVSPFGPVGAQLTYGAMLGYGQKVFSFRRKRGSIRIGGAFKYLIRQGQVTDVTFAQLFNLQTQSLISSWHSKGVGVGLDVGAQAEYKLKKSNSSLLASFVIQDLGNTSFENLSVPQRQNFITGLGYRYGYQSFTAALGLEMKQLLDHEIDWHFKTHAGLSLGFPILSLFLGLYEFQPSFGLSFDFYFFNVRYQHYKEEFGATYNQNPKTRQFLEIKTSFAF